MLLAFFAIGYALKGAPRITARSPGPACQRCRMHR